MSSVENLRELFLDEVKDLLNAERQLAKALPKMIHAATSVPLKDALALHLKDTDSHIDRLETILADLGESAQGKKCRGMEGLLEEGSEILSEYKGAPALDAGLVGAAQAVEHYEIARYGTLIAWAEQLGKGAVAKLLTTTLNEEKAADKKLTSLAESGINRKAA